MNTALASLHGVQALSEQADAFSFGVLTPEPNGPARSVAQLLSDVDEKLYEKKRRLHIANAQYALLHSPQRSPGVDFTYDTIYLLDALVQSTDDYVYVCNMKTGVFCYPQAMVDEFDLPGRVIANAAAVWGAKVLPTTSRRFWKPTRKSRTAVPTAIVSNTAPVTATANGFGCAAAGTWSATRAANPYCLRVSSPTWEKRTKWTT